MVMPANSAAPKEWRQRVKNALNQVFRMVRYLLKDSDRTMRFIAVTCCCTSMVIAFLAITQQRQ